MDIVPYIIILSVKVCVIAKPTVWTFHVIFPCIAHAVHESCLKI